MGLKIVAEFDLISITGRFIQCDPSRLFNIRVCCLGFHLRTRFFKAHFPLYVEETLRFEKVVISRLLMYILLTCHLIF